MTRREARVPWIDVFKFVICKLHLKEDEAGSLSTPTGRGEVQGWGWQVQAVGCALSASCALEMGCSPVIYGYSFAFLESGPFPLFTSLACMCLCACPHKYTHCALTQLIAKGSVHQATSQKAFISRRSYGLVEGQRTMSDHWEYRFHYELHLAHQLLWYGYIPFKLWKTAKPDLFFLK